MLYVTTAFGRDNELPGILKGGEDILWVVPDCRCGWIGRARPARECPHADTDWRQVRDGRAGLVVVCFDPGCEEQVTIAKYSRATHTAATIRCDPHRGRNTP
ncbi:hypothetical protein ACFVU0_14590 [Streptomyces sp. NPDC058122]|uniref:hypothetical protein n=1 Tax=Streptomyces sp. NPDC058122 TaxID=3346349 RepID=UPI0036E88198